MSISVNATKLLNIQWIVTEFAIKIMILFPGFFNLSPTPDHCDRTHPISIGSYKNIELYKNNMYPWVVLFTFKYKIYWYW